MKDTLFLLVTCTKDVTRFEILKQVVDNLVHVIDKKTLDDLLVFDNASSYEGSVKLLTDNFVNVYQSKTNIGLWSAIHWCLKNYQSLMKRDYKYLYIIESDLIHSNDTLKKLETCESFLESNSEVGFIRTEEFLVSQRHLYDKGSPKKDSRKYAWVTQNNFIQNKRVEFFQSDCDGMYKCNFLAKLPALSRIQTMKEVFLDLSNLKKFNETDYQKLYYQRYKISAVLDGGIFHSKLGNENTDVVINGSRNYNLSIDYRPTRSDSITEISLDDVVKL
jgi:hypothetical protein